MSDIYTQENGSKKKFLAPLLVMLLCMVSLTAAGYAYSSTINGSGGADVDEKFIIDIYERGETDPITAKIVAGSVEGLVFTTDKVIDDTNDIYGDFEIETSVDPVVLYGGDVMVTAEGLKDTTTQALIAVSDLEAVFKGTDYTVTDTAATGASSITIEIHLYATNAGVRGDEVTADVDGKYTVDIDAVYQYDIVITAVEGKVQGSVDDIAALDADAFADNVLGDVKIDFGFKFAATAIEA